MIERAKVQSLLDELNSFERIDGAFKNELKKSFEQQTLNIGVVGKMKAGKSSLTNAVIFGRNILPTGVAPVTVTLTEISYGTEERAIVELLTKEDVADLKEKASYTGDNESLQAKATAAQCILDSFQPNYESFLGDGIKTISLDELKDYVEADGKFSGLAKSVKIRRNNDSLKGVTIIDTPGFNDPISSRGETTKNALSKCHVLLFVHNSDGYDAIDVGLLEEQIEYAGISEILDILNKIDSLGVPIKEWEEELSFFNQQRSNLKLNKENVRLLIEKSKSTYSSSLMALCGLTPLDEMEDDMRCFFSQFEENFEELCQYSSKEEQQEAFVRFSNIHTIINEINRISKDGTVYLIEGPIKTLKGKLSSTKEAISAEIDEKKARLASLNSSIEDKRRLIASFEDFMVEVMKQVKLSTLGNQLYEKIDNSIKGILSYRDSEGSKEFSEERYPDPSFGSTGVTKNNVTNYDSFISGFASNIRDRLYSLKESFTTVCKTEINNLKTKLSTNPYVTVEQLDRLGTAIFNTISKELNDFDIIISPKLITSMPDGNLKQWGRLRARFLSDYDDAYFVNQKDGLLMDFKEFTSTLSFVEIAQAELSSLRDDILAELNKTPGQLNSEISQLEEEIGKLEEEIKSIDAYIMKIDNLEKEC